MPFEGGFSCIGLLLLPWSLCACIVEDFVSMGYLHALHLHHTVLSDSFYELISAHQKVIT
jgi:hypothetical protein